MAASTTSTARKNHDFVVEPPIPNFGSAAKDAGKKDAGGIHACGSDHCQHPRRHHPRGAKINAGHPAPLFLKQDSPSKKNEAKWHAIGGARNPILESPAAASAATAAYSARDKEPTPQSLSTSHCYQSALSGSLCSEAQHTEAKDSFLTARVSDATAVSVGNGCSSAKISDPINGRSGSSSSGTNDECCSSSSSFSTGGTNKPHKANDARWEAIRAVRSGDGYLGLRHFRLLRKLGCGDIGSVYLGELSGTGSHFAMKVMDKAVLASRKKLARAQTEREILQCLDHPFLPTLYTHFETDKFSCLVMEFCPGGDLHTLRQRQPGKYFSENAARYVPNAIFVQNIVSTILDTRCIRNEERYFILLFKLLLLPMWILEVLGIEENVSLGETVNTAVTSH